ncbi:MAG: hypothetical protein QNJ13_03085 [Paracoccaceae bacterium]|nr:hypothetical protein [Paracoccaceae bacterium]
MKWSKLKQRIEGGFADQLNGRVEVWLTRYRGSHDAVGEAWFTVDGERLSSFGTLSYYVAAHSLKNAEGLSWDEAYEAARQHAPSAWDVSGALFDYLNLSIDDALASESPIIRGIAMLDRRLGKRRLARLNASSDHEFVRDMLRVRLEAEGLSQQW